VKRPGRYSDLAPSTRRRPLDRALLAAVKPLRPKAKPGGRVEGAKAKARLDNPARGGQQRRATGGPALEAPNLPSVPDIAADSAIPPPPRGRVPSMLPAPPAPPPQENPIGEALGAIDTAVAMKNLFKKKPGGLPAGATAVPDDAGAPIPWSSPGKVFAHRGGRMRKRGRAR
jgi:hypothetical protein